MGANSRTATIMPSGSMMRGHSPIHARRGSPRGSTVKDERTLRRIRSLAIPPAWTDVWICADANGHVQATGRDAKGRKQYRYHAEFREVRESAKFEHIMEFARLLPKIASGEIDAHKLKSLRLETM